MSFQAVTWAIAQKTGSPSAKAVLWSIANYANEDWFAYPKQERIATDSEQSVDSVQKRNADLVACGLIRRIKLKRFGRRTHDFLILQPSPYFAAPVEDLRPFIPAGCDVIEESPENSLRDAAAECGSDIKDSGPIPSEDSVNDAAADCGSVEKPESEATLPQLAVHATALVRQQEYVTNQESLPQTPSQAKKENEIEKEGEASQEVTGWIEQFRQTYVGVCSNPTRFAADVAALTTQQRDQAMQGARGQREILRKNPKSKGIVGPNRYISSSALWAEYGRFAPTGKTVPPPRVWVEFGSEEWRARAVLYGIIGREMPTIQTDIGSDGKGADFLGTLPSSGLILAKFTNELSKPTLGIVLDADKPSDRPCIAAWRERVRECLGVAIEPLMIYFDDFVTNIVAGREFKARRRVRGLRVPSTWPPAKHQSTGPPSTATKNDDEEFAAAHGLG